MIARTIEVSGHNNRLSIREGSLVVEREGAVVGRVPVEDIGVLILDSMTCSYTHAVLAAVLQAGAVVIPCGPKHLPAGIFLPQNNTLQTQRVALQAAAGLPLRKSLWKQVVQAKIANQAGALAAEHPGRRHLKALIPRVRSGDPSNVEAQAAKVYWRALFEDESFRRDPEGDGANALLNYGYMVLRASVARAICGAGLHPSLGLHHKNRSDTFSLADDLVEPFRPLVDVKAKALAGAGRTEIDRDTKSELLGLLTAEIEVAGAKGPLLVALERLAASLVRCYAGEQKELDLPRLWT
jgi:CRISPR-associated protein Cas1